MVVDGSSRVCVEFFSMFQPIGQYESENAWSKICRTGKRLFVVASFLQLMACGATSARLSVGPVLDSKNNVAIESTFSLGFGMPVDYSGRSRHFVQGLAFIGGGADVDTGGKIFTTGIGADHIYTPNRRFNLRSGMYFVYRNRDEKPQERDLLGWGAHLALMPVGASDDSSYIVPQFCVGPEFRVDQSWDADKGTPRTHFGFPLVLEVNLLVAGD